MHGDLNHAALKAKQRSLRDGFPEEVGLRIHRAISWIGCAESQKGLRGDDARFVFLWVAFNAAYAIRSDYEDPKSPSERERFQRFFDQLDRLDADRRIYGAIWDRFSGPIRTLMDNKYLFQPMWRFMHGSHREEDWEEKFRRSHKRFLKAAQHGNRNEAKLLGMLFDRLYVLRNQVVHGGATWNSQVNRDQVRDGARIMGFLMPLIVDIMMDNPTADWGTPLYPVLDKD